MKTDDKGKKKRCGQCKQWRARSEFGKCASNRDGLKHRCRQCRSANGFIDRMEGRKYSKAKKLS